MEKKFIKLFIFLLIMIFPLSIFASSDISISTSSIEIEVGKTKTFTITADNCVGEVEILSNKSDIVVSDISSWETGAVEEGANKKVTITLTGKKEGKATITINIKAASFDEKDLTGTKTISVTVRNKSTNNNLSSINIDGKIISGFNSSTTTYNVDVSSSSISLTATAQDTKSIVTITGPKTLSYGTNKYEIKVTSEAGTVKTYVVNVNRKKEETKTEPKEEPKTIKDSNSYLLNLQVKQGNIEFNKDTLNYSIVVENEVDSVEIVATAESKKSKITGTGKKQLILGNNIFEIVVEAEDGTKKVYTLSVTRVGKNEESLINSLTINNIDILFDPNVYEYRLLINSQKSLDFVYDLNDGVTASITGNENLDNGSQIVLKLQKDEVVKEYVFNIIKKSYSNEKENKEDNKDNSQVKSNDWISIVAIIAVGLAMIGILFISTKNKNNNRY